MESFYNTLLWSKLSPVIEDIASVSMPVSTSILCLSPTAARARATSFFLKIVQCSSASMCSEFIQTNISYESFPYEAINTHTENLPLVSISVG